MKIKLELFGATRDLNSKEFIEFNIEEKSSIKELRKKIINYVDDKFKGNENFKKIIETSAFCTEDNNIVQLGEPLDRPERNTGSTYKVKTPVTEQKHFPHQR